VILLVHLAFGDNPWQDGIAKRVRRGLPVRSIDYARTYGWWAAAFNALLASGLLLSRRIWVSAGRLVENRGFAAAGREDFRRFAVGVGAAMLAATWLAAPRLSHSLWGDEEWTVRHAIDGVYLRGESGDIDFHALRWRDTFFEYRKPSNHVGFTVPARLSLSAWRALADPGLSFVSETAIRTPSLVAGVTSVAVVALLLRSLGMSTAGVFAAWLLALHPWLIRYASEARGYALLVLFCPLALLALWRVLQRGTWGRWAIHGLAQVWMLWTWPPSIFFVGMLNLAVVASLWHVYGRSSAARPQWLRWGVTSLVSLGVFLQLMLGNLVQLVAYAGRESGFASIRWLRDLGAHFVAGVGWSPERAHYHDLIEIAQAWPISFWLWVCLTLLLIGLGVVRLLWGGWVRAFICAVLVVPGPAFLGWAWQSSAHVNHWSLLFALPSCAVLLATGLSWLPSALPGASWTRPVLMLLWLGAFATFSQPARVALRAGSLQPMRESVELTRPSLDPFTPENQRILTVSIQRGPDYYDPNVVFVTEPGQLREIMERADAEAKPLYVNWGRPGLARKRVPELVDLVENDALFEEVAILYGFEPRGQRLVHRYRGRAAAPEAGAPR